MNKPAACLLAVSLAVAALLPAGAVGRADTTSAAAPSDFIRSIDNMHLSRDLMCTEQPAAWIDAVVQQEATLGVNTIVVDTPYDDAGGYRSCPVADPRAYEQSWVSAIRRAHLHVWFRQVWNSWQGIYGQPTLTYATSPAVPYESSGGAAAVMSGADVRSYVGRTYQFILQHPGLFASGDIFTPAAEPDDAGVPPNCTGPCQFPNAHEFNRFLQDSMQVDRQAFASIGAAVAVGFWGIGCTNRLLDAATVAALQGVMATDCYQRDSASLEAQLSNLYATYGVPLVLGEWGDIWDRGAEPASTLAVSSVFAVLRAQPYVVGFNYWQAAGTIGSEDVLDPSRVTLTGVGRVVQGQMPDLQRNTIFAAGEVGTLPVWLFGQSCTLGGAPLGQIRFACRFRRWDEQISRTSSLRLLGASGELILVR